VDESGEQMGSEEEGVKGPGSHSTHDSRILVGPARPRFASPRNPHLAARPCPPPSVFASHAPPTSTDRLLPIDDVQRTVRPLYHMAAEPAWQEALRARLVERNVKESAYSHIIEQCPSVRLLLYRPR
jgi:hypothetical protein